VQQLERLEHEERARGPGAKHEIPGEGIAPGGAAARVTQRGAQHPEQRISTPRSGWTHTSRGALGGEALGQMRGAGEVGRIRQLAARSSRGLR
jgi:hypothetical protein